MAEFKFECPHCKQRFQCDEAYSGREIQCPTCKLLIHIPPIPGRTAQYKPEVGKTWATYIPSGVPKPKGVSVNQPPEKPK